MREGDDCLGQEKFIAVVENKMKKNYFLLQYGTGKLQFFDQGKIKNLKKRKKELLTLAFLFLFFLITREIQIFKID